MPEIEFPELSETALRLEMARTDWLYGEPGKKPLRDTERLAKKHGLTTLQIAKFAPSWMAELRAHSVAASVVFGNAATPEILEEHEKDVGFMREYLDRLEKRLEDPKLCDEMQDLLLKQYLKLQTRWSHLVGIESALKVSTMAKLTVVREEIKAQVALPSTPAESGDSGRKVDGKVFDIG